MLTLDYNEELNEEYDDMSWSNPTNRHIHIYLALTCSITLFVNRSLPLQLSL